MVPWNLSFTEREINITGIDGASPRTARHLELSECQRYETSGMLVSPLKALLSPYKSGCRAGLGREITSERACESVVYEWRLVIGWCWIHSKLYIRFADFPLWEWPCYESAKKTNMKAQTFFNKCAKCKINETATYCYKSATSSSVMSHA